MGTYASRSTPGGGCRGVDGEPQDPSQGAQDRRPPARGVRRGHRVGARALLRAGRSRTAGVTIQECSHGGVLQRPRRDGAWPREQRLLRPAEPHVAVRVLHRHRRGRSGRPGVWDVLRVVAVDDCGVRINPMIVEGQIMGGLTEAYAMANMQFITFDADGNCVGVELHGLPPAHRLGDTRLRTPRGRDSVPAPPDRCQGNRRVRHGWRSCGIRECRHGCPQGTRCAQHRHATAGRPRVRSHRIRLRRLRRTAGEGKT